MDGLSALDELAWRPEYFPLHPAYQAGNALGWLYRGDKQASTQYPLSGRLYLAKNGWLLLSVPNALVRGVFDALTAPGAELPTNQALDVDNSAGELLNAHIPVMTAEEVRKIGPDKISERGHMFGYALGALKEMKIPGAPQISKMWGIQIASPALSTLRKSYGLSGHLHDDQPFHIVIAVRRKNVIGRNDVSKAAAEMSRSGQKQAQPKKLSRAGQKDVLPGGAADNLPDREFPPANLAEGAQHERKHADNDQVAKKIAKDHLSEEPDYDKEHKAKKAAQVTPKRPRIIDELLAAKNHSDAGRYAHKHDIVRRLMTQSPQDWEIDDDKPKYKGVTHKPTKFKAHVDPVVIPPSVMKKANSVYMNQFRNMFNLRNPIRYDFNKPVFQNIQEQLQEVKRRGDFMLAARRNQQLYRSALDPQYRYQQAMDAFEGRLPQPDFADQVIERYGDQALDLFPGMRQ
jgi:hypothetical protein